MIKLIENNLLNEKELVLNYYSKLGMNENQLVITLLIMSMVKKNSKICTSNELAMFMNISKEQIDTEMDDLFTKKLLVLDVKHKVLSFDPMLKRILAMIENETETFKNDKNFEFVANKIEKKLSFEDIVQLNSFVEAGISKSKINEILITKKLTNLNELIKELASITNQEKKSLTWFNWLAD
ncbi:DnaD family protein [Spiroplasma endosymbiont of Crioceris asparagi]|uniref:DnaD family protein n=1 Tax=Spiroplasma endosymbiont of Crioceris asparagi TaxID=3066286 RepID=UPI0030D4786D